MSHFKGHFEGAKTFLTPQIVPSAALYIPVECPEEGLFGGGVTGI
jgi:hypothetical protein